MCSRPCSGAEVCWPSELLNRLPSNVGEPLRAGPPKSSYNTSAYMHTNTETDTFKDPFHLTVIGLTVRFKC